LLGGKHHQAKIFQRNNIIPCDLKTLDKNDNFLAVLMNWKLLFFFPSNITTTTGSGTVL
jgi:hypothetical protein